MTRTGHIKAQQGKRETRLGTHISDSFQAAVNNHDLFGFLLKKKGQNCSRRVLTSPRCRLGLTAVHDQATKDSPGLIVPPRTGASAASTADDPPLRRAVSIFQRCQITCASYRLLAVAYLHRLIACKFQPHSFLPSIISNLCVCLLQIFNIKSERTISVLVLL
jgi:hypothetical protein